MLRKIITTLLLFLTTTLFLNAEVSTSESVTNSRNSASSVNSLIKSNYEGNFNSKIALPMTTGSQITTVDGKKSGSVSITCNTDKILLAKITILNTNNITVNVKLDINLDGSFEKDLNFNNISGIHTTGVFSCTNGVSSCTYYKWEYSSGTVQLININSSSAIAPYCINDTCGSKYTTNSSQILNDISGTLVALIQGTTSLVVTNVIASNTSSEIYAQKYDNCSNTDNSSVIYNASSGIPSQATLQAQASSASFTSDTSTVLNTISTNETNNPVTSTDIADIKTVASTSTSTATVDSSDKRNISYTSTYKDANGNYVTSSGNSSMNFEHISPEYCMVEWQETYTNVTTDNNVRGVTASGLRTTKKSETRLCSGQYNNICPVSAGETIKYDCGNLNKSINQAAGALNALKGIVDDMICNITQ
jgi:hypothetical protein